jgi:hypothetical protein
MILLILATTAAMARVVATQLGFGTAKGFLRCMVMIVITIRPMHMWLVWFGFSLSHQITPAMMLLTDAHHKRLVIKQPDRAPARRGCRGCDTGGTGPGGNPSSDTCRKSTAFPASNYYKEAQ